LFHADTADTGVPAPEGRRLGPRRLRQGPSCDLRCRHAAAHSNPRSTNCWSLLAVSFPRLVPRAEAPRSKAADRSLAPG
jgi:hypothetical protein